jgi:hypothetical protein
MGERSDAPLSVPEWADCFDVAHYMVFLSVIDDEMTRRGWRYHLDGAAVVVEANGEQGARFGLVDLARKCHHADPTQWPVVVTEHFDSLARSNAEMDSLDQMDLDRVRQLLKVRLYPPGFVENVGRDNLVRRPVAPCLDEVLVADLPSVVATVKPERVQRWGCTWEELLEAGRDNVRGEKVHRQTVELEGGVVIQIYEGESHFVASRVLVLDLGETAPLGALVALPTRHLLSVHVIADLSTQAEATRIMFAWAEQAFREGPGALSPHLFWLAPSGDLLQFELEVSDDGTNLTVTPPERFVNEVLLPLAQHGGEPSN